jgi:type 1 fimbriae regulatory protein FimB/type 1 fimbriae regulatory protein FimE
VRALRELRWQFPGSNFVFTTERGGPFIADAINRLIKRTGSRAKLPAVHAHMLRRACGYALAMPATTRAAFRIGPAIDRSSTRRATLN